MRRWVFGFLAASVLSSPLAAQTLTPVEPPAPTTTATAPEGQDDSNPWRVQCSPTLCEMVYFLANEAERSPSRVLIYDVGDLTILEYTVPLGVGLSDGIVVQIDGEHNFRTEMLVCRSTGCLGYLALNDRIINLMKAGGNFALAFQNYADKEYYAYNYTLMGFTAAYNLYVEGKNQLN